MRRKDREITDICAILELVSECKVCRLAMTDELDGRGELVEDANPCAYGYTFASVIGTGNVEFIEYTEEKIYALNRIMKHQAGIEAPFTSSMADAVCLYKMTTNDFTCKIRAK